MRSRKPHPALITPRRLDPTRCASVSCDAETNSRRGRLRGRGWPGARTPPPVRSLTFASGIARGRRRSRVLRAVPGVRCPSCPRQPSRRTPPRLTARGRGEARRRCPPTWCRNGSVASSITQSKVLEHIAKDASGRRRHDRQLTATPNRMVAEGVTRGIVAEGATRDTKHGFQPQSEATPGIEPGTRNR